MANSRFRLGQLVTIFEHLLRKIDVEIQNDSDEDMIPQAEIPVSDGSTSEVPAIASEGIDSMPELPNKIAASQALVMIAINQVAAENKNHRTWRPQSDNVYVLSTIIDDVRTFFQNVRSYRSSNGLIPSAPIWASSMNISMQELPKGKAGVFIQEMLEMIKTYSRRERNRDICDTLAQAIPLDAVFAGIAKISNIVGVISREDLRNHYGIPYNSRSLLNNWINDKGHPSPIQEKSSLFDRIAVDNWCRKNSKPGIISDVTLDRFDYDKGPFTSFNSFVESLVRERVISSPVIESD